MSIKSDKWIRRMAEQTGMIEPFEPGQVKEVNGQKIVSYGTSSYGYDIRCSREFRLFTNINSTIVDPKNFDANSFVDVKSDVCTLRAQRDLLPNVVGPVAQHRAPEHLKVWRRRNQPCRQLPAPEVVAQPHRIMVCLQAPDPGRHGELQPGCCDRARPRLGCPPEYEGEALAALQAKVLGGLPVG